MAELLKNIYNDRFFEEFTQALSEVLPDFNKKQFLKEIYTENWGDKELKQRMRHITLCLHQQLSTNFEVNAKTLVAIIAQLLKNGRKENSLEYMLLPDYIEVFGQEYTDASLAAMEHITQFTSCEFAIRPFIIKSPKKILDEMLKWSTHKHPMVRRLASEGCRPRLPWAMALPALKKNPTPILPILENLKNDPSESVRRSVANNLNDISKDNPELVITIAKKWLGNNPETDWLVKHGCRTLLKQGHQEILPLFGFGAPKNILITDFKILTPKVKIGESLAFSATLTNTAKKDIKLRLEYALYYKKANGSLSKKVFKISEKIYAKASSTPIERKQSFKPITTRKFHLGEHKVALIVNGKEFEALPFELVRF